MRLTDDLPHYQITQYVQKTLSEDLGRAGDITTNSTVSEKARAHVAFVARQSGVVSGLDLAEEAFRSLDPSIEFIRLLDDGTRLKPGDQIATIRGGARAILTGERTALNFMGHLSGISTATREIVDAAGTTQARICCTRKTTPGLRSLEKYAVRAGGGMNHRFGLDDAILIKDNHIAIAGGIASALGKAKTRAGHMVKVELEVDTLEQLDEALSVGGADAFLLDNMGPETLTEAVRRIDGRALSEASGRITKETVAPIAQSGVDLISVGWITHSAPCLDIGLDFIELA